MGSSNLQCAISKETISTGDKTVTLILEPVLSVDGEIKGILKPASSQGEYFKINSLPILGEYEDYGRSIADDKQDNVISLVKDFYDFDYSEELGDEWGSSGWQMNRGEPVSSPHDTNTAEFVVLKAVYDVIINSTDKSSIMDLLKSNQIELAFGNSIDNQLLTSIDGMGSDSSVINAAVFLKGIRNIGASLTPAPTISAQMAMQDFEMSRDTRDSVGETQNVKSNKDTTPFDFCLLTRKAISNNDVVYFLPIVSNMECGKSIDLISFDNYSVTARYNPISKPVKCVFNNGTYSLLDTADEAVIKSLANTLSVPIEDDANAFLNQIVRQPTVKTGGGHFIFEYQVSYVVLSEQAFNYLNDAEGSTMYLNFEKDANLFLDSFSKLYSISKIKHSSFESFKESIAKSGVFSEKKLDLALKTIDIYSARMDVETSNLSYLIELTAKHIGPKSEDGEKCWRPYNSFFEQVLNVESDRSILHSVLKFKYSDKLDEMFSSNCTEGDFYKGLKSLVDESLVLNKAVMPLLGKLNKAAITLMPFDDYTGELNVLEQRKIIDAIDVVSYEHLKFHIEQSENDW